MSQEEKNGGMIAKIYRDKDIQKVDAKMKMLGSFQKLDTYLFLNIRFISSIVVFLLFIFCKVFFCIFIFCVFNIFSFVNLSLVFYINFCKLYTQHCHVLCNFISWNVIITFLPCFFIPNFKSCSNTNYYCFLF